MSTATATEYPKLRPLDIRTQVQNGHAYFLLRDPLQLSENSLLVPQPLGVALAAMDGATTIREAAEAFGRRFGIPLQAEDLAGLVNALDEVYLLDNERSRDARQRAVEEYRSAPFRPPLIAGQGYPASAADLRGFLDAYLGEVAPVGARGDLVDAVEARRFGMLSPHIDYGRGGQVYAQVWQQAADAVRAADLVILLGTDHYGDDAVTLTRQHYATPYGVLPTAFDIVDRVAGAIGEEAAYAGELRHRGEHSLELVAVWLHHMRGGEPVDVVPVLVGSFQSYVLNGASPESDVVTALALDALSAASEGRRVAVIASGDLSHVGSAFGGPPLTTDVREEVQAADDALIGEMHSANATGFFESIRGVRDRYNVCGVSPIYLTLRMIGATVGELHGYASCPADAEGASAVTVCGIVWR